MDSAQLPLIPADHGDTLRMEVAQIGFLLERLSQDCDDLQFVRELTENARQAGASLIVWDFDRALQELTGAFKLCCIDNGCGMTPDEMRKYINQLSSSTHRQALDANYGVGAKVAAATRNPAGVIYQSWKEGHGAMVQLWRDPNSGQYGLMQQQWRDGRFDFWIPLDESAKPKEIDKHGTKVILLGKDDDDNTIDPPPGTPTQSRWISRYLNGRYFFFPEQVEVKAREGWRTDPTAKGNLLRTVRGQGPFLDEHKIASGILDMADARVHWWILDEPEQRKTASDLVNTGHVATMWQNELYEMRTGRSGVAGLQQFGIIFGYDRVVLYIEPLNGATRPVTSNTARTQLLIHGQPLPYTEWAAEFRDHMPQPLKDHMEAIMAGSEATNHHDAIAERLRNYTQLYKLSRYRRNPAGKLVVGEPNSGGRSAGESEEDPSTTERRRDVTPPARPHEGNRMGRMLAAMLAAQGEPGEATKATEPVIPVVEWVSVRDNTRTQDFLEDRAARYLAEQNMIQANADFRVFTDMVGYWCKEYRLDDWNPAVVDAVHDWFEQALIETVLGCQALQGERHWSAEDIDRALSEEGLTAAVMQRYHVANAVKRKLGSTVGSLKERAAS